MIAVIDTETTGLDASKESIVEIATVMLLGPPWRLGPYYTTLVKPTCPIGLSAMAVHHITEADVSSAPPLDGALAKVRLTAATGACAAHNAAFDKSFLPMIALPWICTWRCAHQIWPDAPGHSNGVLRYWLPVLNEALHKERGASIMRRPPHRALPDAWVTAHILLAMLRERTVEELVALTAQPILLSTVRFGKHRGEKWASLPRDYLHWVASRDFDADTIHTAQHHLGVK